MGGGSGLLRALPAPQAAYSSSTGGPPHFFLHLLAWLKHAVSTGPLSAILGPIVGALADNPEKTFGAVILLAVASVIRTPNRTLLCLIVASAAFLGPVLCWWQYAAAAFVLYLWHFDAPVYYKIGLTVGVVWLATSAKCTPPTTWTYKAPDKFLA